MKLCKETDSPQCMTVGIGEVVSAVVAAGAVQLAIGADLVHVAETTGCECLAGFLFIAHETCDDAVRCRTRHEYGCHTRVVEVAFSRSSICSARVASPDHATGAQSVEEWDWRCLLWLWVSKHHYQLSGAAVFKLSR